VTSGGKLRPFMLSGIKEQSIKPSIQEIEKLRAKYFSDFN